MKPGDLVRFPSCIYQVLRIKNDSRGCWAMLSVDPKDTEAIPCPSGMSECWFSKNILKNVSDEE